MLKLEFDLRHGIRIEQLPEMRIAEQIPQQLSIQREGGGALLGDRGVVLVHERGDEVEQQRRGERTRTVERDVGDPDPPIADLTEHVRQRREIEVVLEDLPVGLEHDRERPVSLGHGEEIRGAASL